MSLTALLVLALGAGFTGGVLGGYLVVAGGAAMMQNEFEKWKMEAQKSQ